MSDPMSRGQIVRVAGYGIGEVQSGLGDTVIIRFGNSIHEVTCSDVQVIEGVLEAVRRGRTHAPLDVVVRVQAEAITSVNSAWGMFARSRIALLPHQLWVCRKVLTQWPARWLVADDVGLGKTIEAGLILSALLSRRQIRRLLIMCPASLVDQWQYRLRTMFDIRTSIYAPAADTARGDFWNTNPQVVASLQTLRLDSNGRHERMLEAEPWDLVVVDEAHHLNADEQAGPTLGFKLVQQLVEGARIRSMVFFTGTPHRGKPFGFFSLLGLLQPERFNPKLSHREQLRRLPDVMIRNNKQNVTDLRGTPLFKEPVVQSRTYEYSPAEQQFYDMLTEFIVTGKAYASSLGGRDGRAVMLVLISMQKLASSSVAAILRALRGRLGRIGQAAKLLRDARQAVEVLGKQHEAETEGDLDDVSKLDETLAEVELRLMDDEQEWLNGLIAAGENVQEETKIQTILKEIRSLSPSTSVLFFTEYKATQSLLMSSLINEFGESSVTFINGDGEAREVVDATGQRKTIRVRRDDAAARFNRGAVRFLVSTEAAGEGIDLQGHCYTLIHVDLPWNPMRLHQRVGRLNRYGQTEIVRITNFRNPSTVESRIWDKLNEKIAHINVALRQVMADPEDMFQLVLGMAPPEMFRDIFADGAQIEPDKFDAWFDRATSRFGGSDVIDTVKDLVGNCARFDFQEVSQRLPKVDLKDLEPFLVGALVRNRRQPKPGAGGLSFKTPDEWLVDPAILPEYSDMIFDRERIGDGPPEQLLGVGHKLVDMALSQAEKIEACFAVISGDKLPYPIVALRVYDRITTGEASRSAVLCGAEVCNGQATIIPDWVLLQRLNELSAHSLARMGQASPTRARDAVELIPEIVRKAIEFVMSAGTEFRHPDVAVVAILVPAEAVPVPTGKISEPDSPSNSGP
ncbi:MAG: SNF2-related protein [Nitrospirota bacterium]|nr:SNF2-related protein [Nitrospirota bacterium]